MSRYIAMGRKVLGAVLVVALGFSGALSAGEWQHGHENGKEWRGEISERDRAEIQELMVLYGNYFDYRQSEAWASLFTQDGELNYPTSLDPNGPRTSIIGYYNLVAFNSRPGPPKVGNPVSLHLPLTSHIVRTGPKTAMARTVVLNGTAPPVSITGVGMWVDELVETHDGWRIKKRTADVYGWVPISEEFLP